MYIFKNYSSTTIAIILLVLWLLGVVGAYAIGAFIHILLVIRRQ
ncbi:MAG: lmo0937 family membrane protein [Candidatus Paceibacterota bacterium]